MIELPEKVKYIINTITKAGYEAYAVGGCIRDSILGRKPDDWDITTSASPLQVKALFRRTIDTGIRHGTVTVMWEGEGFEVTTYRIDGEYEDSRHPKEVIFTSSLIEDLKRRDFTINAMAYNEKEGLVDAFGGIEDIKNKMIRCVGSPGERFSEDALRLMRAVRFSAQLGYQIEEETAAAVRELAPSLRNISAERIQAELIKLLISDNPGYLEQAYEMGITGIILPEFDACMETPQRNPHHMYSVGVHTLKALGEIRPDKALRLAMLFHDMGKPGCLSVDESGFSHFYGHPRISEKIAEKVLRRLKLDNDTIHMVKKLVRFHDCHIDPTQKGIRRAMLETGEDAFPLLLEVKRADMLAQSLYQREEKERSLEKIGRLYREVLEKKQCVSLKTLAVNGNDLIEEAGMSPGKELGEILSRLLDFVVENPDCNDREILLPKAWEMAKNAESTEKGK